MLRQFAIAGYLAAFLTSAEGAEFRIQGDAPYCDAVVVHGPNPRGASASAHTGRSIILIDPSVLDKLPYVRGFVLAHECGHHALGHTSPQGFLLEGFLFQDKELAADCWAAQTLSKAGQGTIVEQQIALFEARKDRRPGPRYPAWRKRVEKIRECLKSAS